MQTRKAVILHWKLQGPISGDRLDFQVIVRCRPDGAARAARARVGSSVLCGIENRHVSMGTEAVP